MLEAFHRLGRRLYRVRGLLWALAAAAVILFLASLLVMQPVASQTWLLGSVMLLLWCIAALSVAHGFSSPLPSAAADAGWITRMRVALIRAYLWLMALLMGLASLAALLISLRTLLLMLRG